MLRTPTRILGFDDMRAIAASKVSDWMTLILGSPGVSDGKDCEGSAFVVGSKPGVYVMSFARLTAF